MSGKTRIETIKKSPLTWRELDTLTAAERYLKGVLELPMVEYALPCFPKMDKTNVSKVTQIGRYSMAVYHLRTKADKAKNKTVSGIVAKAARIYEQEAQRILGSLFPLDDSFWKTFYKRQESEGTKPLVAVDALHFLTDCQEQVAHQLLVQAMKSILKGHYDFDGSKRELYENAERLLVDLPLGPMRTWLNHQLA